MKTFRLVRQAALNLARHRLRTVLMMLGVVVGIASLHGSGFPLYLTEKNALLTFELAATLNLVF